MTTNKKPTPLSLLPLKYRWAIFGNFGVDDDEELGRLLGEFGLDKDSDGAPAENASPR